jgi:hypothetical protein
VRKVIGKRDASMPRVGGSTKSEKHWRDALRVALMRTDEGDPRPRLARIAERVVLMAVEGDMQAVKEIGDRIDGRVPQQVDLPQDVMQQIVVTWARSQPAIIDADQQSGDSISDDTVRAPKAVLAPPRED